jgi:hypothetical protein
MLPARAQSNLGVRLRFLEVRTVRSGLVAVAVRMTTGAGVGWIKDTLEAIKEHTRSEPVECPRGWGQVAFVSSVWCVPPLFGVDRSCPIGGVGDCGSCAYSSNPDAFRLSDQLGELERLRADGQLSSSQCDARRDAIVRLHAGSDRARRAQITTAWMLTPLGALVAAAGVVCAMLVHSGFWGMAGGGLVFVVVGLSFWGLSRSGKPRSA